MTIWVVIWVVLMIFWLFGVGGYYGYTNNHPALFGNVLIPWVCVLILGLIMFGAISGGSISGPVR